MKRPPSELDDHIPPPKRTCHTHVLDNAIDDVANHRSNLETLPAELLLIILEKSLEPSLIHTSRQIYNSLPSFVPLSRALALRALAPRQPNGHGGSGEAGVATLPYGLKVEPPDRIRRAVFESSWFSERHLRRVHQRLLYESILEACAHSKDGPSRGQRKRIKSFVSRDTAFSTLEQLNLR